jgi:transporter family-2 protein
VAGCRQAIRQRPKVPPFSRELGAATLTALMVTGQLVCSVVLDHFGWVGFTEHAAGIGRIVGCLFMVTGFFLIARF